MVTVEVTGVVEPAGADSNKRSGVAAAGAPAQCVRAQGGGHNLTATSIARAVVIDGGRHGDALRVPQRGGRCRWPRRMPGALQMAVTAATTGALDGAPFQRALVADADLLRIAEGARGDKREVLGRHLRAGICAAIATARIGNEIIAPRMVVP